MLRKYIREYPSTGLVILMIMASTACSVVKTPYNQSSYYDQTSAYLNKINPVQVTDSIEAGFSRINLIPEAWLYAQGRKKRKGLPVAGYGSLRTHYATGIHDSVFVRAIALKIGSYTCYIVSAEMLIIPPDIADSVIKILSRHGIERSQLFFSASHTHSGIGGWGDGPLAKIMAGRHKRDIGEWLANQISGSIIRARDDIKPARIGMSSFEAPQFIINRITDDPAHNNISFDYIIIEQEGGKRAVAGTYSAHSTTISGKNRLISGDYPGAWSRRIETNAADIALFCGGSMGGQSPYGPGEDFYSGSFIGEALADSLLVELKDIQMGYTVTASSITLPVDMPEFHFRLSPKRNLSTRFSKRLMPVTENIMLQALELNDRLWFFTPGDFSSELALELRRKTGLKGYRSVVTGYNGSYVGYILPGKYFYLDHYEPRKMSWYGPWLGDYFIALMDQISQKLMAH